MNKEEFINEVKKLNINISDKSLDLLEIYCNELLEYNKHTNLTAIRNKGDVYLKHFYDSLTLTKCCKFINEKIIDIGSGAGFPGLVLKIVFPEIELTLLDSNNKKTKFLEEITKKLNLNVNIINDRSENYIKNNRESFDIVTARAVKNLPVLVELCLAFVKLDGVFLAMKGDNQEEINESTEAIKILGGSIEDISTLQLPIENSKRTIIKIRKKFHTNLMYPRPYEKIIKKPLKK